MEYDASLCYVAFGSRPARADLALATSQSTDGAGGRNRTRVSTLQGGRTTTVLHLHKLRVAAGMDFHAALLARPSFGGGPAFPEGTSPEDSHPTHSDNRETTTMPYRPPFQIELLQLNWPDVLPDRGIGAEGTTRIELA